MNSGARTQYIHFKLLSTKFDHFEYIIICWIYDCIGIMENIVEIKMHKICYVLKCILIEALHQINNGFTMLQSFFQMQPTTLILIKISKATKTKYYIVNRFLFVFNWVRFTFVFVSISYHDSSILFFISCSFRWICFK